MYDVESVDLTAFVQDGDQAAKRAAAQDLASKLSSNGFLRLEGHGIEPETVRRMFDTSRQFFQLPMEDKMKAPHPKSMSQHRGYSSPGQETGHLENDADRMEESLTSGKGKYVEYKETFDIGNEDNGDGANVWLPDEVLPGFRSFEVETFRRFQKLTTTFASALAMSLELSDDETKHFLAIHSGEASQMRLNHYPSVRIDELATEEGSRLPAHNDWSSFTFIFTDAVSGLQYEDRASGDYIDVEPREGQLLLNVGDALERFSNGRYPSSLHRVVKPSPKASSYDYSVAPERYSIVLFASVTPDTTLAALPSLVKRDGQEKYEVMSFGEYAKRKAEWHFQNYVRGVPAVSS